MGMDEYRGAACARGNLSKGTWLQSTPTCARVTCTFIWYAEGALLGTLSRSTLDISMSPSQRVMRSLWRLIAAWHSAESAIDESRSMRPSSELGASWLNGSSTIHPGNNLSIRLAGDP